MDERKNKMTDQRYREILPMAYMTAAIEKGRQPRPVEVGLCARAIVDAEDENNLAYRVAMATKIHCTIVGVKRVSTKTGYDKYEITYRTFGKDEDETIPSPLIGDFRYGKVTEWLWAKKNDDGTDYPCPLHKSLCSYHTSRRFRLPSKDSYRFVRFYRSMFRPAPP